MKVNRFGTAFICTVIIFLVIQLFFVYWTIKFGNFYFLLTILWIVFVFLWVWKTLNRTDFKIIDNVLLTSQPFEAFTNLSSNPWDPTFYDNVGRGIDILEIKKIIIIFSIRNLYRAGSLGLINSQGEIYLINCKWYIKKDIRKLLQKLVSINPHIEVEKQVSRIFNLNFNDN